MIQAFGTRRRRTKDLYPIGEGGMQIMPGYQGLEVIGRIRDNNLYLELLGFGDFDEQFQNHLLP